MVGYTRTERTVYEIDSPNYGKLDQAGLLENVKRVLGEDAERIISELFDLWMKHPEKLPPSYQEKAEADQLARVVCDYIAGMTDNYIYEQYEKHIGA